MREKELERFRRAGHHRRLRRPNHAHLVAACHTESVPLIDISASVQENLSNLRVERRFGADRVREGGAFRYVADIDGNSDVDEVPYDVYVRLTLFREEPGREENKVENADTSGTPMEDGELVSDLLMSVLPIRFQCFYAGLNASFDDW